MSIILVWPDTSIAPGWLVHLSVQSTQLYYVNNILICDRCNWPLRFTSLFANLLYLYSLSIRHLTDIVEQETISWVCLPVGKVKQRASWSSIFCYMVLRCSKTHVSLNPSKVLIQQKQQLFDQTQRRALLPCRSAFISSSALYLHICILYPQIPSSAHIDRRLLIIEILTVTAHPSTHPLYIRNILRRHYLSFTLLPLDLSKQGIYLLRPVLLYN